MGKRAASSRRSSSSRSRGRSNPHGSGGCDSPVRLVPLFTAFCMRDKSTSRGANVCASKPDAQSGIGKTAFNRLHLQAMLHLFDAHQRII